jgi:hypothetical protein
VNSYDNGGVRDSNPGAKDGEQLGIGWGASVDSGSSSVGKMKLPMEAHASMAGARRVAAGGWPGGPAWQEL